MPYDGGTSKGKFKIQDKPKFKKRFSNQNPPNIPKAQKNRVSNPRSQGGKNGGSPSMVPQCTKCGNRHVGKCLWEQIICFGCRKSGHMVRDCVMAKS